MKRYEKIKLEADKDVALEVIEQDGQLIIKAVHAEKRDTYFYNYAHSPIEIECSKGRKKQLNVEAIFTDMNDYSQNYMNPPIPEGYKYIEGSWKDGFVIDRQNDGSQFIWIPVGSLDSDGQIGETGTNEKFGRRKYLDEKFISYAYNEPMSEELVEQVKSVMKYGGFYISRYNISQNDGEAPKSIRGAMPLTNIDWKKAIEVSRDLEKREDVKSHLVYGSEYDSVLAWLLKSKAKTFDEMLKKCAEWGNVGRSEKRVEVTGSRNEWCVNHLYDWNGNVDEYTQEMYEGLSYCIIRGYSAIQYDVTQYYTVLKRFISEMDEKYETTGFRVSLYIK